MIAFIIKWRRFQQMAQCAMVFLMRKPLAFLRLAASVSFATLLVASAQANPAISAAPAYPGYYQRQSPLGGGLIEALVGEESQPVRYATPPASYSRPGARVAAYAPQPVEMQRAVDPMYMRAEVEYRGAEAPGTIVVDTPNKFLYLVHGRGRATRYGIGVGRPGFEWSGVKTISRKAEWPDWTPPSQMLARRPDLPRHMEGGPANPLGARALYLGSSLYRIHGTNEPHTIGQNVSSGCIRMMNDDVVDLYDRVPVGARVVVR
jgi:lipoprotein-anchoring transpeptidase ErfK/SrfK